MLMQSFRSQTGEKCGGDLEGRCMEASFEKSFDNGE